MEIQPGFVNWAPVSNMPYPGETRAMAWQAIGHGSDGILYLQWRNALNGQETMHGSLIGPDGKPLPVYDEVVRIGRDMATASPVLAGMHPVRSEERRVGKEWGRTFRFRWSRSH